MTSLLKTAVNSMTMNKRNLLVRDSLQKQLNMCVMEMQSAPGLADDEGRVGNCDESMSLCSVLEAIFLHGLKDTLLNRVTEALSGPDFDATPQPSFWGPLLVFSHSQIIDQIQSLSQLTTEVGYCRAWIRMALNEGLLASYFGSIKRDNSALKPYYNRSAYIRDPDYVEVAQRLVESMEHVCFELACNSSLLNFWSTTPLLIAGIWSPPMKSCPVFSAVDIAKTITTELTDNDNFDEIETASSIGSLGSFTSSQSMFNNATSITEDEALKIILANKPSDSVLQRLHDGSFADLAPTSGGAQGDTGTGARPSSDDSAAITRSREQRRDEESAVDEARPQSSSDEGAKAREVVEGADSENGAAAREPATGNEVAVNDATGATVGNSLIGRLGWSTSFEECQSSPTSPATSRASGAEAPRSPGDGPTYDALIQSYHTAGNKTTVPDLQEFLDKYPKGRALDERGSKAQPESKVRRPQKVFS